MSHITKEGLISLLQSKLDKLKGQLPRYQEVANNTHDLGLLFWDIERTIENVADGTWSVDDKDNLDDFHTLINEDIPFAWEAIRDRKAADLDNDIDPKTGEKRK